MLVATVYSCFLLAGHNVTPQMGQGCNSALEDAGLLAAALQQSGHDVAAGLAKFQKQRMPQVRLSTELCCCCILLDDAVVQASKYCGSWTGKVFEAAHAPGAIGSSMMH
jgi:hypothetical protein